MIDGRRSPTQGLRLSDGQRTWPEQVVMMLRMFDWRQALVKTGGCACRMGSGPGWNRQG